MQRLRAEHHIHIGRALQDRRTFLARHAATHADQQIGVGQLKRAHPPQVGEHFFLGFFAYRAGVEQNDIGLFRPVGLFHAREARNTSAILSESYSFI